MRRQKSCAAIRIGCFSLSRLRLSTHGCACPGRTAGRPSTFHDSAGFRGSEAARFQPWLLLPSTCGVGLSTTSKGSTLSGVESFVSQVLREHSFREEGENAPASRLCCHCEKVLLSALSSERRAVSLVSQRSRSLLSREGRTRRGRNCAWEGGPLRTRMRSPSQRTRRLHLSGLD